MAHLTVRVDPDDQEPAQGFRAGQVPNVAHMEQVKTPVSQDDLFTAGACLFDGFGQLCPVQYRGGEIWHYLGVDSRTFAAAPCTLIDSISSSADAEDVPFFITTTPPA